MLRRVARDLLEMAIEASRDSHPNEFGALLRRNGDVIDELLLLPGTISGTDSALFRLHMLPIDPTVAGSLHSHPSPHPYPSDADIEFFGRLGEVHIIVASPYNMRSWRAYDRRGEPLELEVVRHRR
ncbi:MAG: Mov34/MPN/PAD-1 family protein [Thermoplasmata archaeon]|nr:Mov34/MPN/PAD-1 family protein [Thermoplasmata archaeon]